MTASPKSVPVRRYAAFSLLLVVGASCTDRDLPLETAPRKPAFDIQGATRGGPQVMGDFLVDLDHGQLFPDNKQNEPPVTLDPLPATLIPSPTASLSTP